MRHALFVLLLLSDLSLSAVSQAAEAARVVTLAVSGMTCPVCPITVRKALSRVPGVQDVAVDYDSKTARVRVDPEVQPQALTEATGQAGYPSRLVMDGDAAR
jgi:mercuric ion binding protein